MNCLYNVLLTEIIQTSQIDELNQLSQTNKLNKQLVDIEIDRCRHNEDKKKIASINFLFLKKYMLALNMTFNDIYLCYNPKMWNWYFNHYKCLSVGDWTNYYHIKKTIDTIIKCNNLKMFESFCNLKIYTEHFQNVIAVYAIKNNKLKFIKWLIKRPTYNISLRMYEYAAEQGKLRILKLLVKHNRLLAQSLVNKTGKEIVSKLNGAWIQPPINKEHNNTPANTVLTSTVFAYAAESGNLKMMKWLLENKCSWNSRTFEYAALNGNLENMKWLFKHGCPLSFHTLRNAKETKNTTNIKWLQDTGCVDS
jgi:hypothetical protein